MVLPFYRWLVLCCVGVLCFGDSLTAGYSQRGTMVVVFVVILLLVYFLVSCFDSSPLMRMHFVSKVFFKLIRSASVGGLRKQMVANMDKSECQDVCLRKGRGLRTALRHTRYDIVCLLGGTNGTQPFLLLTLSRNYYAVFKEKCARRFCVWIPRDRRI